MINEFCMGLDPGFPDNFALENCIHAIIRDLWLVMDYEINSDHMVDVSGDVVFPQFASFLRELPLQFGQVGGDFDISALENLTSLKGAPVRVGGVFNCSFTKITSLEYVPESVGVLVFDNNISSLATGNRICKFDKLQLLMSNSNTINGLPHEIINNKEYLGVIMKYQNYFEIWKDGSFNKVGFDLLVLEIKEGLE